MGKYGNLSDFDHQFRTDRIFGRISISGLSEQAAGLSFRRLSRCSPLGCYNSMAKTHRLAYRMKATFLLGFNIEKIYNICII